MKDHDPQLVALYQKYLNNKDLDCLLDQLRTYYDQIYTAYMLSKIDDLLKVICKHDSGVTNQEVRIVNNLRSKT